MGVVVVVVRGRGGGGPLTFRGVVQKGESPDL